VHLQIIIKNYAKNFLSALEGECTCSQCNPWLRLCAHYGINITGQNITCLFCLIIIWGHCVYRGIVMNFGTVQYSELTDIRVIHTGRPIAQSTVEKK